MCFTKCNHFVHSRCIWNCDCVCACRLCLIKKCMITLCECVCVCACTCTHTHTFRLQFILFLFSFQTVQWQQTGKLGWSSAVWKAQEVRNSLFWTQPSLVWLQWLAQAWPQLPPQGQVGHSLDTTDRCHTRGIILSHDVFFPIYRVVFRSWYCLCSVCALMAT